MINNNWTEEVNNILEKIRKNSIELSNRHRLNFYEYKGYSSSNRPFPQSIVGIRRQY